MNIEEYFKEIESKVKENYELAREAKKKGYDPVADVEVPLANSLAERVVGLVSVLYPQIFDKRITERILDLEKEHGSLDPAVALVIAEEIAKEKYCKFENHLQAVEAGIRVAMGYMTLGYVSSPIEGFIQLKVKKTRDGKEFIAPYYSGPIRSAGGTEAAFSLVVVDYLREIFGYSLYDPSEDEVKRGIQECYEYHERITNLQYLPSERELDFLMRNLPVQLTGDPSEDKEVYNYKDLERIETNFIRSGFALVIGEGMAQKAPKILKRVVKLQEKGFKLSGWNWLKDFVDLQKKIKSEKKAGGSRGGATYMQDLVAGRPVFAHPSESGAFRLRYGRSRNMGYSTLAIHPASMGVTDGFIAIGTQLKIEKPTKGCTVASCDSIDGPIVKFKSGEVRRISTYEEAKLAYPEIEEIIYLGDILVPYGDFLNRNHLLDKAGYVEQYWLEEIRAKGGNSNLKVSFEEALEISSKYEVPLHPSFIFFWKEIKYESFLALIDWIAHGEFKGNVFDLPYSPRERDRFVKAKRALELIGCEHKVGIENVVISWNESRNLLFNLGIDVRKDNFKEKVEEMVRKVKEIKEEEVLKIVNLLSSLKIKDKSGTFIGGRMGRPEKAKLRKLTGSPHVLFPVGEEGGRLRSVQEAYEVGSAKAEFPVYYCENCKSEGVYASCDICGQRNVKKYYCPECNENYIGKCEEHNLGLEYREKRIDMRTHLENARQKVGVTLDDLKAVVKGVKGTSNKDHSCEHLAKGLLRAKYNLNVNKDGTIRYDMTEMPITHFKPNEIGTSVEKLKELGYESDVNGKPFENENQVLEIFPHDIILPGCPDTPDERADDVFFNVGKFIDDELTGLYGLNKFFKAEKKGDIIGALFGCMAPHTSSTVVGRLIGFSKVQALLASPYIHAAMRRDCFDYDTYLPIKEGDSWNIVKIGELVERLNPTKKVDKFGTKEISVNNFKALGVNGDVGEVVVNNFTKHSSNEMFEIKTSLGKKIKVTQNHKFLVDGKIKSANQLMIGDKLPLPINIIVESNDLKEINLINYLKDKNLMIRKIAHILKKIDKEDMSIILKKNKISNIQFYNFMSRDSFPIKLILEFSSNVIDEVAKEGRMATKRDDIEVPIVIKLSKELLEVIGLYIAEGYSRTIAGKKGLNQVYIASSDKEIRDFVKKTIFDSFGLEPSENKEDRVTFSSRVLYLFFNNILKAGHTAYEKRIPSIFLNLELDKLACILRGYFEGDGSAEKKRKRVSCDSVSEGLLCDLEFCLSRFGIFAKRYEYEKEPGSQIKQFYINKGREVPKFKITKLIIGSNFVDFYKKIGFLSDRKNNVLESYSNIKEYGMRIMMDENFVYDPIVSIESLGEKDSYCLNVESKNHLVVANSIVSKQCDGDEAAVMLLMDLLLNFSKKFLPSHRGGTQDAPLVLNMRLRANEVDDMIFDVDVGNNIPLALYQAAEEHKSPGDIKMPQVKQKLGSDKEFTELFYSYETSDINSGPICSSYKTLPTMDDKVQGMMRLCKKIRAVDTTDVARLVIERHFIRDTRGNLRKFSQQGFRCSKCNDKYRRPPLTGKCLKCGGRLIFTISEGSILKYMQPALDLANKYNVQPYLLESLELTEMYIQSIFGKEKEKQETLF
jgi:DNA polymerase II large subunit